MHDQFGLTGSVEVILDCTAQDASSGVEVTLESAGFRRVRRHVIIGGLMTQTYPEISVVSRHISKPLVGVT